MSAGPRRRKGYAALGISVLNSSENQDQKDIKFRGEGRSSEHSLDLETEVLKNKSKAQDQLLQIVAGLQDGIEDLLAGRVFHPKKEEEEVARPPTGSSDSESEGNAEPGVSTAEEAKKQADMEEAALKEKEGAGVALKKSLAGMPVWIENEVQSEDEDSDQLSAHEGASDDESVGSFLHIAQHDIDDLVQETDEKKLQQQIGWGRAATNRIMYEWKEYTRVKLLEEVNQWFQHRTWAAKDEAEMLDSTEAESRETLAGEHESVRALKTAIEKKDMTLVSSVSSFRQNMDKRIQQHWAAKRKARDQAIAQVQREEELRRQERLRRQQERAAKKFSDIDDQIADLKDSVDQVKGEIHKKELMKQAYPSGKRRASAAGGAKAGDVLAIIASQQEEAQILSGKLAMANQKLETLEEALEMAKTFFKSAGFKNKKVRSLPADDPAGEIVNEEMLSAMKAVLAQLMIEDESLAELISIAISLANSPAGKKRTRNGFLRLDDIFGDKDPLADQDDANRLPSDEIVVSKDPEERKRKLKEIEAECAQLEEDIEILAGVDYVLPDSQDGLQVDEEAEEEDAPESLEDEAEEAAIRKGREKALKKLLSKALAAMEAMRQKQAVLTQSRRQQSHQPSEAPSERAEPGESSLQNKQETQEQQEETQAEQSEVNPYDEAVQEREQQKVAAARLSEEEAALKLQIKLLRASDSKAAGDAPLASPDHPVHGHSGGSKPPSEVSRIPSHRSSGANSKTEKKGQQAEGDSESDVSIEEETHQGGEPTGAGGAITTTGGDLSADDSSSASTATNQPAPVRRRASISRKEADHVEESIAKQQQDNKAAAQEVEELRHIMEALKNAPAGTEPGPAAKPKQEEPSHVEKEETPVQKAKSEPVTSLSRPNLPLLTEPPSPSGAGLGSPSRASKRRSLAASSPRASAPEKSEEEIEELKEQKALKLKDLVRDCQKLAEEKEAFEKEMTSIEEKIRRVKSMDSGGVVELLKKDVQAEKKVDSAEVKELKAEIKKRQSQVNAMRRTWQDMQLSGNRRNALSGAEEEERQRDVAKRFAHVLSFLRASKATELTQEAKKAGLVTESGDAEVVGRTASKFLQSIKKVRVAERPEQVDEEEEEGEESPMSPALSLSPGGGATPRRSPVAPSSPGMSPGSSKQGFSLLMAEAKTGHRGQSLGLPHGDQDQDPQSPQSQRFARRASLSVKVEGDADGESRRRRSFNNILEKAKMKQSKEDDMGTPQAKANSAVRFAPQDPQETPRRRSMSKSRG